MEDYVTEDNPVPAISMRNRNNRLTNQRINTAKNTYWLNYDQKYRVLSDKLLGLNMADQKELLGL
jgi:hypothetical protein